MQAAVRRHGEEITQLTQQQEAVQTVTGTLFSNVCILKLFSFLTELVYVFKM